MGPLLAIRPLTPDDIPIVTAWARQEGFTPGAGDVAIYRHTDRRAICPICPVSAWRPLQIG